MFWYCLLFSLSFLGLWSSWWAGGRAQATLHSYHRTDWLPIMVWQDRAGKCEPLKLEWEWIWRRMKQRNIEYPNSYSLLLLIGILPFLDPTELQCNLNHNILALFINKRHTKAGMKGFHQNIKICSIFALLLCFGIDHNDAFSSQPSPLWSPSIDRVGSSIAGKSHRPNPNGHPSLGVKFLHQTYDFPTKLYLHNKQRNANATVSSSGASYEEGSLSNEVSSTNAAPLVEGLGKGIARDYKMRLPFYKSDITDGLNVQVRTIVYREWWWW